MANRLNTPVYSTRSSTPMYDITNGHMTRDDASLSTSRRSDSALSFRRSESSLSRFPRVEANISKDDRLKLYKVRKNIRQDPHRAVSIDESPLMLIPKARVRNDYDVNFIKRAFSVVPQGDYTSLHLSALPFSPPSDVNTPRSLSRISFKSRSHSRSDSDSGFGGSVRRCVTFDELSIGLSTVSKSLDDIERMSEYGESFKYNDNEDNESVFDNQQSTIDSGVDVPEYLDNFAEDILSIPIPPKIPKKEKKRECSLTEADIEKCHEQNCQICRGFLNERQRIQRYFGGIESFLDWIFSKWGKRKELSKLSRQDLRRGSRPRFCNIVRQVEIHEREKKEGQFGDADYDYYRQHANGPILSRWRKHSHASTRVRDRHALDLWLDLGPTIPEDYYPSLEELRWQAVHQPRKTDGRGGTEGRPGSPISHYGDEGDGRDKEGRNTAAHAPHSPEESGTVVPTVIDIPERKPATSDSNKDKLVSTPVSTRSLNDDFQNTPIQPPPTPEPVTPKDETSLSQEDLSKTKKEEPEKPDSGKDQDKDILKELEKEAEKDTKRRASIQKKEKKPVQRIRKGKAEMEVKDKPIGATPPTTTPPSQDESKSKDIKVDLDVPSLPTVEVETKKKKEKKKPEKHLIAHPKHEEPPKFDPEEALEEQVRQRIKAFEMNIVDTGMGDETPRKNISKPAWVTGRLALSQQSSRFELPMDIVRLENMSALDYIKEFCIITRRRKKLYADIFNKHREPKVNAIPVKELEKAVKSVLVNTITTEHYKEIADMLEINENTKIDLPTFSAISALAERLLCTSFMVSRDQVDMPQKEDIECADFSALDWKLNGVKVRPQIYKLLKQLS